MNSGQFSTFIDPEMGLTRFLWSKAIQSGVVWTNASGYASPEMDRIIEAQKYEPRDERRVELLKQLQKVAMTDLPFLPLMEMQHVTVYSKRLHGLSKTPDAALASLKDVWLEKA
jgi:peptide/nickel transport system substrate-binding protein